MEELTPEVFRLLEVLAEENGGCLPESELKRRTHRMDVEAGGTTVFDFEQRLRHVLTLDLVVDQPVNLPGAVSEKADQRPQDAGEAVICLTEAGADYVNEKRGAV